MAKVKTFTSPLKIFQAKEELDVLDRLVNTFLNESPKKKVISVSVFKTLQVYPSEI